MLYSHSIKGTNMSQEIIDMAKDAGFDLSATPNMLYTVRGNYGQLKAFAKLVEEKATAKEREACVKICVANGALGLAAAIRARGEENKS